MRRIARTFFAAALLSLSALIPVAAFAVTTTTEYVAGAEYATGTCGLGTYSGSFAGVGSASLGGSVDATFDTTICWSPKPDGTRTIIGGSLTLATSDVTLVGRYITGSVGSGTITGGYFCKEVFSVTAVLGTATIVPEDATTIAGGSVPSGQLTHYGVRTGATTCHAYAASIKGVVVLIY